MDDASHHHGFDKIDDHATRFVHLLNLPGQRENLLARAHSLALLKLKASAGVRLDLANHLAALTNNHADSWLRYWYLYKNNPS